MGKKLDKGKMNRKPKDFDWQELYDLLKDEIPRKHYEYCLVTMHEAFRIRDQITNEIINTINYYGANIPESLKHHVKILLRIQLGRTDVDKAYNTLLKKYKSLK